MTGRDGARPPRRPNPAQDRLEPDAVLVSGEGLDHRAGMARRLFGDDLGELFLNLACSSGVAARTWRGRGLWIVQPIARSASQPRCSATFASPSSAAMTAATFLEVQTPPSSGGLVTRSRSASRTSGVRTLAFAPLPRRRSPSEDGPKASGAGQQLLDPAPREARQPRGLGHRAPLRQEPDHLVAPRPRRVPAAAIPHLQLRHAQMSHHPCHACPP